MIEALLLAAVPVLAIGYIVWNHRRKMAEREAASAGRLHELLGTAEAAATPGVQNVGDSSREASSASVAAPEPRAASLYSPRPRVLSPAQTLLYLLLKTGLPEHVVFAQVSLGSIIEPRPGLTGAARLEELRRLNAVTVDFVVADKSMRPLAVVELASDDVREAAESVRGSARTRVAAAGLRYVVLDQQALPRKDAIRAVVLEGLRGEDIRPTKEPVAS